MFHFISVCPVLTFIEGLSLENLQLRKHEVESYLNGKDWQSLPKYLKRAWKYRREFIHKFNFDYAGGRPYHLHYHLLMFKFVVYSISSNIVELNYLLNILASSVKDELKHHHQFD